MPVANWSPIPSATVISTDSYIGGTCVEYSGTTSTNVGITSGLKVSITNSAAGNLLTQVGDIYSLAAAVKAPTGTPYTMTLTAEVYDGVSVSQFITVSGAGSVPSVSNPSGSSWTVLKGTITIPSGFPYLLDLQIRLSGIGSSTAYVFRVDNPMVQKVSSTATMLDPALTFDGYDVGAYWLGTAYQTPSVKGGLIHGLEEQGGHLAANIRHHTGAATPSIKDVADRIVDSTTGLPKQVVTPVKATITTSSATTSSAAPVDLPGVTITLTSQVTNQWVEVVLGCHFIHNSVGGVTAMGINYDGSLIDDTVRGVTSSQVNGNGSINISFFTQITGPAGTAKVIKGQWWTSTGIVTMQATRCYIVGKLVF